MKIWVDADSCPVVIKDILFRAAERTGVRLILVANRPVRIPPVPVISFIQVAAGKDAADNKIVQELSVGDLVVTADIPLAAQAITKGALSLNPRGELYTEETINSQLDMRNFMDSLRANGIETGGPPALTPANRQDFANQLDTQLTRWIQSTKSAVG
jgi:uncharacterized protein YaiI (UPF0178 family)